MCKSNVCTTMYVVALQCVRIPALMNAKNPLSQRGSSSSYCLAGRPVTIYRLTGPQEGLKICRAWLVNPSSFEENGFVYIHIKIGGGGDIPPVPLVPTALVYAKGLMTSLFMGVDDGVDISPTKSKQRTLSCSNSNRQLGKERREAKNAALPSLLIFCSAKGFSFNGIQKQGRHGLWTFFVKISKILQSKP